MTDQATNPAAGEDVSVLDREGVDLNPDLIDVNEDTGGSTEGDKNPDGEQPPVDDDHEEIEWEDGQKYRIPKALKDGILRRSDYTRKTQEAAETKRQAAARIAEWDGQQETLVQAKATLLTIDNRLQQLDAVTDDQWADLQVQNPREAARLSREHQRLRDQRAQIEGEVANHTSRMTAEQERERANLRAAMFEEVQKKIPNWSDQLGDELAEVAIRDYGLSPDDLRNLAHAPSLHILHDAVQGRKAMEELRQLKSIAKRQATAPVQTLRGSSGDKDPERFSPSEMARHLGYR